MLLGGSDERRVPTEETFFGLLLALEEFSLSLVEKIHFHH